MQKTGLVWSGLVWSGLVWSGLVWSPVSISAKDCHGKKYDDQKRPCRAHHPLWKIWPSKREKCVTCTEFLWKSTQYHHWMDYEKIRKHLQNLTTSLLVSENHPEYHRDDKGHQGRQKLGEVNVCLHSLTDVWSLYTCWRWSILITWISLESQWMHIHGHTDTH